MRACRREDFSFEASAKQVAESKTLVRSGVGYYSGGNVCSVQSDPEGCAAEHERKCRRKRKQDDPLRIDPWGGLGSVFGAHYEITNESASSAVMVTSATMITSSDFLAAGFMAMGRVNMWRGRARSPVVTRV